MVPVIIMDAPTAALTGLNPVKVGVANTVKFGTLTKVMPLTVIEILPVVAPGGTDVVMLVVVDAVTTAKVPLNLTT